MYIDKKCIKELYIHAKNLIIASTALSFGAASLLAATPVHAVNQFEACIADAEQDTCTLTENVLISSTLNINRDVTIDLNGRDITSSVTSHMFHIENAELTITGEGKITDSGVTSGYALSAFRVKGSTDPTAENYSVLNIESDVDIELSHTIYGAFITNNSGHAYGAKINFDAYMENNTHYFDADEQDYIDGAGFYINGSVQDYTGNVPVVNLTENSNVVGDYALYIYAGGYGIWNLDGAYFTGNTGIGIKSGKINIVKANIYAEGGNVLPQADNNGIYNSGAVFQIEDNDGYASHIELKIEDGQFKSKNGYVYLEYKASQDTQTSIDSISIGSGVFDGKLGVFNLTNSSFNHTGFIKEGFFSDEINWSYLAEGSVYTDLTTDFAGYIVTASASIEGLSNEQRVEIENFLAYDEYEDKEKYGNLELGDFQVLGVMDINLFNGEEQQTDAEEPLTFTIEVSNEDLEEGYTRKWTVVRFHKASPDSEPVAEIIDSTYDSEASTLTFSSDKFSQFVIIYNDTAVPAAPNSGVADEIIPSSIALSSLIFISAAAYATIKARR